MDPLQPTVDQWAQLARAAGHLAVFTGLVINTALAFLLAHAIIPSLVTSGDALPEAGRFRSLLYSLAGVSLLLTLYAFGRAISIAVPVLAQIYPRFAI